jgi:arsenite methyltransferase
VREHRTKWTGWFGALQGRRLHSASRQAEAAGFTLRALESLPPESTVVDLGAGTGLVTLQVAQRLQGGRVIAVDIAPEMLEQLARRARAFGLHDRLEERLAPADDTGLEGASVDRVVSVALLHEVPSPAAVLAEAYRLLRPGGRLALRDFAHRPSRSWLAKLMHPATAHGHLRPDELRGIILEAGFRELSLVRCGRHLDAFARKPGVA